jgi:phage head-tail adaptor, putative, SPP1 family
VTSRRPYRPQAIGNLRERVDLQRSILVRDPDGGMMETWVTVATVFARLEPVKSQDEVIGGGIRATEAMLVHIRHREDVATDWRILWQGKPYLIDGMRNLDERRQYLTLSAHWVA